MSVVHGYAGAPSGGIHLHGGAGHDLDAESGAVRAYLAEMGLDRYVTVRREVRDGREFAVFRLDEARARQWAPDFDTFGLAAALGLDTHAEPADLEREILLAMLLGPAAFPYPSCAELRCSVRVRRYTAEAGRKTLLAFDTEEAERPMDCWAEYTEQRGFTLRPGQPLIPALQKTTQPECSGGKLYSFSCYRATEYVMLLGMARGLADFNPPLLAELQQQWETRAMLAVEFQDVFLREYGTLEQPMPFRYYVPGDRVWFRNPDEPSSNAEGYEGSWVVYLGEGLFSNFWKPRQHYTFIDKCVEIFHWRNATYLGADGKLKVDEDIVDARVAQSLRDPQEVAAILQRMLRLREPFGVYRDGGCVDASREYVRCLCPGTAELVFPGAAMPVEAG
jgi:hypothetical protein